MTLAVFITLMYAPALLCCCLLLAVTRFARETGDIAALSSIDIKLLALAHTLEAAAHGTEHLAAHAAQVNIQK